MSSLRSPPRMPCTFRSISNGGKFRPPVPKILLKLQPRVTGLSAALHGMNILFESSRFNNSEITAWVVGT